MAWAAAAAAIPVPVQAQSAGQTPTPVRVWQDTMTIPTYEEAAPDPNPPFDLFAGGPINYPYTLLNNLTDHRVAHVWRTLNLENGLPCSENSWSRLAGYRRCRWGSTRASICGTPSPWSGARRYA